jgi:hypothetical protein
MIRRFRLDEQRHSASPNETLDAFDRDLVKMVLEWAPYGRPPEDEVLPRFGISVDRLDQRAREIALAGFARNLCIDDRVLLIQVLALLNPAGSAGDQGLRRHRPVPGSGGGEAETVTEPGALNIGEKSWSTS